MFEGFTKKHNVKNLVYLEEFQSEYNTNF